MRQERAHDELKTSATKLNHKLTAIPQRRRNNNIKMCHEKAWFGTGVDSSGSEQYPVADYW